jgi:hypothetical protein
MARPRRATLRTSALFYAGALSLHELRYLVGWGPGAERALADQGHAYLTYALPWAVALAAAGVGQLLWRLTGPRDAASRHRRSRMTAWLGASLGLLAIYASQETVEGLFAPGHPVGLAGVFGHGGLVAIPLALAIGAVIVAVERGAAATLAAASRLGPAVAAQWHRATPDSPLPRATPAARQPRAGVLAVHLAGRAPPAARA